MRFENMSGNFCIKGAIISAQKKALEMCYFKNPKKARFLLEMDTNGILKNGMNEKKEASGKQ